MATVSVSYSRKGEVHTLETGAGALGSMVIDNTNVPAEARSGTAKQLLAASALFCYCSALVGALEARGARYTDIQATASLELGKNEHDQARVTKMRIETKVDLPQEDEEIFKRCVKVLRQGCLVTASLHEGIAMEYDLQANLTEL